MSVSKDTLKSLLRYEAETGKFFWLRTRSGVSDISKEAGSVKGSGYRAIEIYGRVYQAHILAWLYVYGSLPSGFLDHINTVKTDNRISNLRIATNSENQANKKKSIKNTSGFKGVTWNKKCGKWQASIKVMGRNLYLGLFDEAAVAHQAYAEAANRHFGQFARSV